MSGTSRKSRKSARTATDDGAAIDGRTPETAASACDHAHDPGPPEPTPEETFGGQADDHMDALTVGVLVWATDGLLLGANRAACDLLGLRREDVMGRRLDETADWEGRLLGADRSPLETGGLTDLGALATTVGSPHAVVGVQLPAVSAPRWVMAHAETLSDAAGTPERIVMTLTDITLQKESEHALTAKLAELQTLLDALPDVVMHLDGEDRLIRLAPGSLRDADPRLTSPDLMGRPPWESLQDEAAGRLRRAVVQTRASGDSSVTVLSYDTPAGERMDEARVLPLPSGDLLVILRDITDARRTEEALRARERQFRTIYQHTPGLLQSIDAAGRIISVSDRWLEHFGYAPDEVVGRPLVEFLSEESQRREREEYMPAYLEDGECRDLPYQYVAKGGRVVDVLLSATSERDPAGNFVRSLAVLTDVSELAATRSTLDRERVLIDAVLQSSPAAIVILDREGRFEYVNPAAERLSGYSLDEVRGASAIELVGVEDEREEMREHFAEALAGTTRPLHEHRLRTKGGEVRWLLWHLAPLHDPDGTISHVVVNAVDVTEERLAADALRENERLLSTLLGNLPGAAYRCAAEPPWRDEYLSSGVERLTGYGVEQWRRGEVTWQDVVVEEDYDRIRREAAEALAAGLDHYEHAYRIRTADGEEKWVLDRVSVLRDDDGRPTHMEGLQLDITDQRRAEQALGESERSLRRLMANLPGVAYRSTVEPPWRDEYLSAGIERLTGYSSEQLLSGEVTWQHIVHPDDWERGIEEADAFIAAGHAHYEHEYRIATASGETRWIWDRVTVVRSADGTPTSLDGLLLDVTDRHQAEEALAEKERSLRTLLGNLSGMAYRCANDPDWTMQFVSEGCVRLTGHTVNELVDNAVVSYGSLILPEDRDEVWAAVQAALERREPWAVTYRIRAASGRVKWVWERGVGVWSTDDGELAALEGFITDVTQRVEAQQALEEREQRLDALMSNVPGMVYRCQADPPWRDEFVSAGALDITGYEPHELLSGAVAYTDLVHPDDLEMLEAEMDRALADRRPWRIDYRIVHRSGDVRWVSERGVALRDAHGEVVALEGLITDVTAVYAAQERLAQRERELAGLVANTPGMVYRSEIERPWRDIFVSEGALQLTGYSPAELTGPGLTYEDLLLPEDVEWSDEVFLAALADASPWALDYRIRDKHGDVKWVSERGSPVLDDAGEMVGLQGLVIDITEFKDAQERLAEQQRMVTTLLGNVPGSVYRCQIEAPWQDEFIGSGAELLTGYPAERLIAGDPAFADLMHVDDVARLEEETRRATEERRLADIEYRITAADGAEKWVWDRFVVVRDDDDRPVALEGLLIDVTDRHVAERALAASRAELDLHARIATLFLTSSQDDMFAEVLELIREATGSRWGFFGFVDDDGSLVAPSMSREVWTGCQVPDKTLRFPQKDWGDNVWSRALRSGETQRLDGPGKVPEGHLPIARAVAVPVNHRDETIGVVIVSDKECAYDDHDVRLLESVAEYIGPVLHQWRKRTFEERARRMAEDALRESEQQYRTLYEQSPVGVFVYDADLTFLDCNEAFVDIAQAPRDAYVQQHVSALVTDASSLPAVEASLKGEAGFYEGPSHLADADRELFVTLTTAPRLDAAGTVIGGVGVLVDRTAQKRAEEQMQHLLVHDSLTGLPNRSLFMDRVKQALAHARRHRLGFAVALIELDRFENLRERLGHEASDALLVAAAERFTAPLREEDTVARMGGQEFALLLPGVGGPAEATAAIETLMKALAEPVRTNGHELFLSASVGVAVYPTDGADGEELVRNAEVAAHRAMGQGGHQWRFFHTSMNAERAERLTLEADLHRALERQQFVLHYQPELDATGAAIVGVEALLRWQHPERGLVPPLDFIPVLEESGLMDDVGAWVLEEACRQAKQWNGRRAPALRVGVNLSPVQFQQQDVTDRIAGVLSQARLQPELLELEITESVALRDPDVTAHVLTRLKQMGVRVALDDFGTGYSSLSHVARLPITTVKIDRSFVRDVTDNAVHAAVVSSVVTLAHRLHLEVVAEGVETDAEHDFLRDEQCDVLQGFLFSKPLPADDLTALLERLRAGGAAQT